MQTSLNLSLARVLHVYGDHTRLLADTGITPLQLTKYVHLAPLHFKLTITRPDTLLVLLCKKINTPCPLSNLHTTNYHIRYATLAFKTDLQTGPLFHLASQTSKNRLLAFRNMMKKIISDLWKGQLYNAALIPAVQPLGKNQIAWDDLHCSDLFKTTLFLLNPHNQLHFFDSQPQPTTTSLLSSTLARFTPPVPRMMNDIAHRVFPCKSFEMTPFFTALPLHSPNQQSKALCLTFDDSIFGHGQPIQTPKK